MDKFIVEYMHSTIDDSLIGKEGFFADDKYDLVDMVNHCELKNNDKLEKFCNPDYPFQPQHMNKSFKLFYYDPYYNLKIAVEKNGKTLEVNLDGVWTEVTDLESFFISYPNPYPPEQYRTELNRRIVTHRELSRWLAQGNGEGIYYKLPIDTHIFTELRYNTTDENKPVQDIIVRKWGDDVWCVPSATYLGLDN